MTHRLATACERVFAWASPVSSERYVLSPCVGMIPDRHVFGGSGLCIEGWSPGFGRLALTLCGGDGLVFDVTSLCEDGRQARDEDGPARARDYRSATPGRDGRLTGRSCEDGLTGNGRVGRQRSSSVTCDGWSADRGCALSCPRMQGMVCRMRLIAGVVAVDQIGPSACMGIIGLGEALLAHATSRGMVRFTGRLRRYPRQGEKPWPDGAVMRAAPLRCPAVLTWHLPLKERR